MPELPEVENVKKSLEQVLTSKVITQVELKRKNLRIPFPKAVHEIVGQKIEAVERRGKFILIKTAQRTLINHLGMSGSWRILEGITFEKHDHFVLHLNSKKTLVYNDPRRFGLIDIAQRGEEHKNLWLNKMGPEPLDQKTFHAEYLLNKLKNVSAPIKNSIMNQQIVVGVGNIYASEALFLAKINPVKKSYRLSLQQLEMLIHAIQEVLQKSINEGGTTFRDFKHVDGSSGDFKNRLNVYARDGLECNLCGVKIKLKKMAGRSTYWCSSCQR